MKKFGALAALLGVLATSCSGGAGTAGLPTLGRGPSGVPSQMGMHSTVKPMSVAAAPAGWAATATGALNLANATSLGAVPDNQTITVHVALQLRNVDQLKSAVGARQIVPNSVFMSTYAPTADQVAQVKTYLQSQGFQNIAQTSNNILISGTATAAQVSKAFNTSLTAFTQNGANVFANTSPAYVPQALAGTVLSILGLNNAQAATPKPKKDKDKNHPPTPMPTPSATPTASPTPNPTASPTASPTPSPSPTPTPSPTPVPVANGCTVGSNGLCVRFYTPADYQIAYDALGVPTASNTSIAIMTEGQLSQSISDLRWNERVYNMPQVPVTIVPVEPMSSDTAGSDEWTLDMVSSTGIAANVKQLYLYNFASLSDADIVLAFNKWTTDNIAPVANSSFGGCEAFPYLDGAMLAADEILTQAASQGQTMFVSTGDTGAYCGVAGVPPNGAPAGLPFVEWPASSPYVVAVGGTDLFTNPDGTYLGESAWEAGGGGLSQFEYSPFWETGIQPVGNIPTGGRGLPDVAMDAALETGEDVYTSSVATNGGMCTPCTFGGTSLASPLAAGVYARLQSAHNNTLGFGAPAFYRIYAQNPSASETNLGPPPTQLVGGFHDILSGTNGGYTAAPRYDYTTGLGTFDAGKTNAIIGQ